MPQSESEELPVSWVKYKSGKWCPLETVDLSSVDVSGVYIIWYVKKNGEVVVVRVGQGDIKARLERHRKDKQITRHASKGVLFATWAYVPEHYIKRVEAYLGDLLDPIEGERFPNRVPLRVNLPDD